MGRARVDCHTFGVLGISAPCGSLYTQDSTRLAIGEQSGKV